MKTIVLILLLCFALPIFADDFSQTQTQSSAAVIGFVHKMKEYDPPVVVMLTFKQQVWIAKFTIKVSITGEIYRIYQTPDTKITGKSNGVPAGFSTSYVFCSIIARGRPYSRKRVRSRHHMLCYDPLFSVKSCCKLIIPGSME